MAEEKKTTKTVRKTVKATAVKIEAKAAKAKVKTEGKVPVKATAKPAKASYLEVPMYDLTGTEPKTAALPKEIFTVEAKPQLLAQYVRVYLTNARQGNAATKTRAEVIGTTAKLYRQKGTGRARHGSKKAATFVGGGVIFGPQPRDISLKINKKQKRKAFLGALTLKAQDHAVSVLSNSFLSIEPKTRVMAGFLKKSGNDTGSVLLVYPKNDKKSLLLATRNIPGIDTTAISGLNTYQVLKYKKLLFVEEALTQLKSLVAKS